MLYAASLYLFIVPAHKNSYNLDLDLQVALVAMLKERRQASKSKCVWVTQSGNTLVLDSIITSHMRPSYNKI